MLILLIVPTPIIFRFQAPRTRGNCNRAPAWRVDSLASNERFKPLRRHWKFCDSARTLKGVIDRRSNGSANRCDPAFTRTLETVGIERAGGIFAQECLDSRHFTRGRHQIVGERYGERIAAV